MKSLVPKEYSIARNIIICLDALIAILIIFLSRNLIQDSFGKASLSFGFVMISVVTLLKFLDKF